MGGHGTVYLGQDRETYGKAGTGTIDYDPDYECGGPPDTPGRQCAYQTNESHVSDLALTGREGRKMHVNIASYRDPLCPRTLYNLYTKSQQPEKLFARVLQQNDPEVDIDCLEGYCKMVISKKGDDPDRVEDVKKDCPYIDQISIHNIHAKEAAGPTWARGLLSKDMDADYREGKVHPQDHCMSIDSHMDFEPRWDDRMVDMWEAALNEYAVLSTYVVDIDHIGQEDSAKARHEYPHLCMVTFTSNVRTHATKAATNLSKPKLTVPVWGAGLSFSKCHAELKVQVDPHTPHIFDGEEFNRAARFFTYGYDIYTPNHVYVLHDYHKSQSNPVMHTWYKNKNIHGSFGESNKRLGTMIDLPIGERDKAVALRMKKSKYGLGDRRTLDQLIQFSGIDLRHEKPNFDGINRCGNVQWVPFTEHPEGVNHIPKFDNTTEDPIEAYDPSSIWYDPDAWRKDIEATEKVKEEESGAAVKIEAGLPEDSDLSKQHQDLEEVLEAEEISNNGLDQKHEDLEKQLEEAAVVVESEHKKETKLQKVRGALRGGIEHMRVKAADEVKHVKGYLDKHPLPVSATVTKHGFNHLPLFVKCNVFVMIVTVLFFIIKSAGTGRAFKKKDRKREL